MDEQEQKLEQVAKDAEAVGHAYFSIFADMAKLVRAGNVDSMAQAKPLLEGRFDEANRKFGELLEQWFLTVTGQMLTKNHMN